MDVRHQAMSSLTSGEGPVLVLLFFLLPALFSFSFSSTAADTLNPDQSLADGQTLVSNGGIFVLGFFSPGNSLKRYVGIWYNKVSVQTVVWVANRQAPITGTTGILSISGNGSLVVADDNSTIFWSTATAGATSPVARLLDDGNLVVTDAAVAGGGGLVWQSFDHPTDTLLPGMKLGWDLKTGLNRNLTAWTSDSDPSPGIYTMAMDVRGDPEIFLWSGSSPSWRTGPWDGLRFSGIPDMETYSMFTFDFVSNSDEVYYSFHIRNQTIISRLIVDQSGTTQRLVWLDTSRLWNVFWFAPKDQCDTLSACGPNGVCDPNNSPICSCLHGFQPKSPANWALRDGRDGCVRRTALDCRNRTDGFVTVAGAKLPDTSSATVDMAMSLDQCEVACSNNCSCRAYASANISAGSGCIIWTTDLTDLRVYTFGGDDLYVRLAAADLGSTSNQSRKRNIEAIGITLGGVLGGLLFICTGYYLWNKKKKKKKRQAIPTTTSFNANYTEESVHGKELELPLFDLDTIIAAIDNFSNQNKIGEGGFGPVYKGKLGDEQEIAVKRLAKTSVQGLDEFKNEVMLIVKLQHRNLVRLLGCCIQGEERLLIYEYMPNRSLDAFLFDKMQCATLDWQTRYKIIIGIARGLVYLHQDSRFRIIHRDLKASNILLDADMNPKISDFGMARIFGGDEAEVNTRKVVGTYGYMSPEYAMDGIFSVKSDVFSFGVLVLEIISGKKNRGVYLSGLHQNLLGHAWSSWKEGNALELVDESMAHSFSMTEALKCIKVGLLCVQERPEDRPTMSSVVLLLGSERAVSAPPKQPGFIAKRSPFEMDSSTSKQDSSTLNEISVTIVEGR